MRANLHSRQVKGLSPCSGTQADGQQHSGALATTVCRVGKEEVTLSEPLGVCHCVPRPSTLRGLVASPAISARSSVLCGEPAVCTS